MTSRRFINDFQTFKEDTTYTITKDKLHKYFDKKGEDPEELSDAFPQKVRFEFGDKEIISTHEAANGTTFRYVYEGKFNYSNNLALKKLTFKAGYAVFHDPANKEEYGWSTKLSKGISGSPKTFIDFERLASKLFDEAKIRDEYEIYKGKYENIKGSGNKNITKGKYSEYFKDDWHEAALEEDLITGNSNKGKNNNKTKKSKAYTIDLPEKFTNKSADKITNFNASTDVIKIDTDSFGIKVSGTFASGKNKRAVMRKLARQDFDFLYDEQKGGLYFNENGADKGFGDGGIIAILKGVPDLTKGNLDFI